MRPLKAPLHHLLQLPVEMSAQPHLPAMVHQASAVHFTYLLLSLCLLLCSNGRIDHQELKALLERVNYGATETITVCTPFLAVLLIDTRSHSRFRALYFCLLSQAYEPSWSQTKAAGTGSQGWWSDADVDKVMKQYDTDNSGDIDFEEFQALVHPLFCLWARLQLSH